MDKSAQFLNQEGKKVPTPPRRKRSYKKKGYKGRRTKLTGDLLQAISEIVAVMEILSISHLNHELSTRGYSLSRSTVFRAMEALGLRVDRERKIWCAGPVGMEAGHQQEPSHGLLNSGKDTQLAKTSQSQIIVTDAGTNLFCGPVQANQTHVWQLEKPPAKFQCQLNLTGADDDTGWDVLDPSSKTVGKSMRDASSEKRPVITSSTYEERHPNVLYPSTRQCDGTVGRQKGQDTRSGRSRFRWKSLQLTRQTKTTKQEKVKSEIGDKIDSSTRELDLTQSTGDQLVIPFFPGAWDEDEDGLGRNVASSLSLEKRGRKRKSDCPAKLASFHPNEMSTTTPPASSSGNCLEMACPEGNCKDSASPVELTQCMGPSSSVSSIVDHPWFIANSNMADISKETLTLIHRANGRESLAHTKQNKSEASLETETRPNNVLRRGAMPQPPQTQSVPEQNIRERADPQRDRLHALTSNLAAKTWTHCGEASMVSKGARSIKDAEDLHQGRLLADDSETVNSFTPRPSTSTAQLNTDPGIQESGGDEYFDNRLAAAGGTWTRSSGQQAYPMSSSPSIKINGAKHPPRSSTGFVQSSRKVLDRGATTGVSSGPQWSPFHFPELQYWMQDVSQKLASMDQQLQHLTQIIVSSTGKTDGTTEVKHVQRVPSAELNAAGDPKEEDADSEVDGMEEEDDGGKEMWTWGRNLPPVNTPQSNDLISKLLSDAHWENLNPFVGGPRLAIRLARDCIFGLEVLSRSTVTGRNGMNPLQRDGVKKIKECLMMQYGAKCSEVEREMLWKMTRESLSQLCKRTRHQLAAGDVNDPETDFQDDDTP